MSKEEGGLIDWLKDVTGISRKEAEKKYQDLLFAYNNANGLDLPNKKREAEVKKLLNKGVDVNLISDRGLNQSLLHYAASYNDMSMMKIAVEEYKANVNVKNENKETPLHVVVDEARHSDANETKILKTMDYLLSHGAQVNAQNKDNETPLHLVASLYYDRPAIVDKLIKKGANVNAANKYGDTPLHKAAENGNIGVLKTLLTRKEIKINQPNNYNETPLMSICKYYNKADWKNKGVKPEQVVEELLKKNPNLKVKNKEGKTVYDLINENKDMSAATKKKIIDMVKAKEKEQLKGNIKNAKGSEPKTVEDSVEKMNKAVDGKSKKAISKVVSKANNGR